MQRLKLCLALLAFTVVANQRGAGAPLDDEPAAKEKDSVLHVVAIKAQHPKAYHPKLGEAFQFYLAYPVVPGKMVDDLKFKIRGTAVVRIGVAQTQRGKLVGVGEISAFVFVKDTGLTYVEFAPIPGHTDRPVKIGILPEGSKSE